MSDTCKTVVVLADNPQGCMTINEADFDANVHVLLDAPAAAPELVTTKADLQSALTERGIEFKPSMTKAELQALVDGA